MYTVYINTIYVGACCKVNISLHNGPILRKKTPAWNMLEFSVPFSWLDNKTHDPHIKPGWALINNRTPESKTLMQHNTVSVTACLGSNNRSQACCVQQHIKYYYLCFYETEKMAVGFPAVCRIPVSYPALLILTNANNSMNPGFPEGSKSTLSESQLLKKAPTSIMKKGFVADHTSISSRSVLLAIHAATRLDFPLKKWGSDLRHTKEAIAEPKEEAAEAAIAGYQCNKSPPCCWRRPREWRSVTETESEGMGCHPTRRDRVQSAPATISVSCHRSVQQQHSFY